LEKGKKLVLKKKGFKPSRFRNHGKGSKIRLPTNTMYQHNFPSAGRNKPCGSIQGNTDDKRREPLEFWGCEKKNFRWNAPIRSKTIRESTKSRNLP
jgi:hypothetical protein